MVGKRSTRSFRGAVFGIAATVAALLAAPAPGLAVGTGGAGTPTGVVVQKASGTGAPSAEPSAGSVTLAAARTTPRKGFFFGYRFPRLEFTIASDQPANDIRVDVVDREGAVVRTFYREDVAPGVPYRVRWDGTKEDGKPARNGRYTFRVSPQTPSPTPAPAARKQTPRTTLALGFTFYGYTFPVPGPHSYNLGSGRLGAARGDRTHQGQDVLARCGAPVVAARGGTVQYNGSEGNAGYYLVIDGRGTAEDHVYMHLGAPSPLRVGEVVRTGQPIGVVGASGNATGCLLHFEAWTAPGWYEGGSPYDALGLLQRWDRYS